MVHHFISTKFPTSRKTKVIGRKIEIPFPVIIKLVFLRF